MHQNTHVVVGPRSSQPCLWIKLHELVDQVFAFRVQIVWPGYFPVGYERGHLEKLLSRYHDFTCGHLEDDAAKSPQVRLKSRGAVPDRLRCHVVVSSHKTAPCITSQSVFLLLTASRLHLLCLSKVNLIKSVSPNESLLTSLRLNSSSSIIFSGFKSRCITPCLYR